MLLIGIIPAAYAVESGADSTQPEKTVSEGTEPNDSIDPTEPTEPTEPPDIANPQGDYAVMAVGSTQKSIMLFDYADNGNYTTVLKSQVSCEYKPYGTGAARTAYIKNLGWHFARYVGVAYYKWTHRSKSSSELENEALLHDIGLIYAEHNGTYGYRRIADEYNATHEKQYNLKRFYRSVHIVGLLAVIRRKRPAYQRSTPEVTAENILNREFTANTVNEKWCTDVTEMKYGSEGEKAYLSAILDLKGRDIVSFAIGRHNNNQLVFETFDLAIQKYPDAHPLFHSDRGFQYTSKLFKAKLDKQGMQQSMSRVGRCIDNGPMEGFWGILKCEMYYLNHFETYEELVAAVEQFVHYYNHQRCQHKLNCLPPATYRSLLEAA